MGQAIAVRTDYTAGEVRRFAQRAKDAAQARRLLTCAPVKANGAARKAHERDKRAQKPDCVAGHVRFELRNVRKLSL